MRCHLCGKFSGRDTVCLKCKERTGEVMERGEHHQKVCVKKPVYVDFSKPCAFISIFGDACESKEAVCKANMYHRPSWCPLTCEIVTWSKPPEEKKV